METENEVVYVLPDVQSTNSPFPTSSDISPSQISSQRITETNHRVEELHESSITTESYVNSLPSSSLSQQTSSTVGYVSNNEEYSSTLVEASTRGLVVEGRLADISLTPPPLYSENVHPCALPPYVTHQHSNTCPLDEPLRYPLEPPPPYYLQDQGQMSGKSSSPDATRLDLTSRTINRPETDKCYHYSVCMFASALLFLLVLPLAILSTANYNV